MIEIQQMSVNYRDYCALSDVTLTIPDRGMTALIGPNGAGKSTLLNTIGRLQSPTKGQIRIDDVEITEWSRIELAQRLAILKQDNQLSSRLKVYELVMLGRFPYHQGQESNEDHAIVESVLHDLELAALADRYVDELSGGQRQRAYIGLVLAQQTQYVLLDEPIAALDLRYSRQIMHYLGQLAEQKSVVLIIHDLNYALRYADQLVAVKDGKVLAHGPTETIATEALLSELYDCPIELNRVNNHLYVLPPL